MAASAAGDRAALAALSDRYSADVYGLCLRVLPNDADAQAALSDTFYQVWRRASRFDPKRGRVRTYLMTVARSRAIDRLRAARTRNTKERDSQELRASRVDAAGPDASAVTAEERQRVQAALDTLAPRQREALSLAYYEGMSHSQVAQHLDIPLGTVKSHIRLGLRKLKSALSEVSPERDAS
jgi:RNA polymerase sigma-70 factor (ECF subfamily)